MDSSVSVAPTVLRCPPFRGQRTFDPGRVPSATDNPYGLFHNANTVILRVCSHTFCHTCCQNGWEVHRTFFVLVFACDLTALLATY